MSGPRPQYERANGGLCKRCPNKRPAGRPVYCSDECAQLGAAERNRGRQERRLTACKRCGGPKELGTRGGRYCAECRRVVADSSADFEFERGRRRRLKELEERQGHVKRRIVGAPDGQKWCARCQAFRPLTSFPPRKPEGKAAPYCRPCQRSYNQERRIRQQFGLTWDEYEQLLADQEFRCAICLGKPRKHALAVDHDHQTGEIRGLLCSRCNHRLLGSANDNPDRLRRAADYLEAFEPRATFGRARYVPGFEQDAGR